MTKQLHCYSFHSVKGGVGKSTLSTLVAHGLAVRQPETPVFLIDMDLTGTSLSDVLPLKAPRWSDDHVQLLRSPTSFWPHDETCGRIEQRSGGPRDAETLAVPYLNDFLLWADPDWSTDRDVLPAALSWRMVGAPDNLRVIPSSALPHDLQRIMPVIFDEEHAAFLEARIEVLLDMLVTEHERCIVVFDTPPTVPGLSHSVLSLGFRLGGTPKQALAEDEYIPTALREADLRWRIHMVASQDRQDLRAMERWMGWVNDEQRARVRLVINRLSDSAMLTVKKLIFGGDIGPEGIVDPQYDTLTSFNDPAPLFVPARDTMQFFGHDALADGRLDGLLDIEEWEL